MEVKRETIASLERGLQSVGPEKFCRVLLGRDDWNSPSIYRLQSLLRKVLPEVLEPETLFCKFKLPEGRVQKIQGTEDIEMFCRMGSCNPDKITWEKRLVGDVAEFEFLGTPCTFMTMLVEGASEGEREEVEEYELQRKSKYTLSNGIEVVIHCSRRVLGGTGGVSSVMGAPMQFSVALEIHGAGLSEVLQGMAQVLRILEKTPIVPLHGAEAERVKGEYHACIRKATGVMNAPLYFLAPKPITLEQKHLYDPGYGVVTVQEGYAVTAKADGERLLMFIDQRGDAYLVNNTFQWFQTGARVGTEYANTLLDGEFITWDRRIPVAEKDMFTFFDAYVYKGKGLFKEPLLERMKYAEECCTALKRGGEGASGDGLLDLTVKSHLVAEDEGGIFATCKKILEKKDHPYHIDGLVFTPLDVPVFAYYPKQTPQFERLFYRSARWDRVLKWKPSDQNTIDFLIKNSAVSVDPVNKTQVKIFTLYNGQRKGKYTPRTITENLRDMALSGARERERERGGDREREVYEEAPFKCIEHYTPGMELARVPLNLDGKAVDQFGHPLDDNMIVEFAYDVARKLWIPLRIRDDKTRAYRQSGNISGAANDYEVARNIWRSMHNPVTQEMIMGRVRVSSAAVQSENEEALSQEGVYYAREVPREYSLSLQMLEFHNLVIKAHLYRAPEKKRRILELACGKAGDMRRWEDARYGFVVGIDISRDNIVNPMNGAYSRVLAPRRYPTRTQYAFLVGDVGVSMERDPIKAFDKESLHLWQILMGQRRSVAMETESLYAVAKKGFDVVSCQFAVHYFWKDEATLRVFLENVSRQLVPGGVFVGTCMDGRLVDRLFDHENAQRTVEGRKEGVALWAIQRKYERPLASPYGNKIDVYLEMTQQVIPEYLVNFEHLVELAGEYGLDLAASELFETTLMNCVRNNQWPVKPTEHLRASCATLASDSVLLQFSALNRWFIFQKRRI